MSGGVVPPGRATHCPHALSEAGPTALVNIPRPSTGCASCPSARCEDGGAKLGVPQDIPYAFDVLERLDPRAAAELQDCLLSRTL